VSRKTQCVIGLLGGIGSGKSTVAAVFEDLGAAVIDADRIASECLRDPAIRARIEEAFGNRVLNDAGEVDRKALAEEVFASEYRRQKLHAIIHPAIAGLMVEELERLRADDSTEFIVIDAPLLLESRFRKECDILLMIRVPLESRIERVAAERGWDAGELKRRESFQATAAEKEAAAGAVIENTGSLEDLRARVKEFLKTLSGGSPS
jgi:dephospho-CoA kinase